MTENNFEIKSVFVCSSDFTLFLGMKLYREQKNPYFCAMGKILSIDYGMKRTGIAITDASKIFATGLDTVATNEIYNFIKELLTKEEIECIVVGKPMNLQNLPTDATKPSDTLAKKLGNLYPEIKIERVDERFTSKLAKQAMFAGGMKKKDRRDKKMVDKISATIILQSYLDSQSYSYLK